MKLIKSNKTISERFNNNSAYLCRTSKKSPTINIKSDNYTKQFSDFDIQSKTRN